MGKNFEGGIIRNIDLRARGPQLVEKAYSKALAVGSSDEINLNDFKNCRGYSAESIKRDSDFVARLEDRFIKNSSREQGEVQKLAMIFETIINEQAELGDWLGPDVATRKASRFDDWGNGIDTIAEFTHPEGNLVLAIDITMGNPTKKLEGIKNDIDKGSLAHIRYFESSDGKFKGHLRGNVPKVIVGAERRTVLRLASMWLENEKKELGAHPVQLQILDEITAQLDVFMKYADKVGKKNLSEIYKKQRDLVLAIKESKRPLYQKPEAQNYVYSDGLYKTMMDQLSFKFGEKVVV